MPKFLQPYAHLLGQKRQDEDEPQVVAAQQRLQDDEDDDEEDKAAEQVRAASTGQVVLPQAACEHLPVGGRGSQREWCWLLVCPVFWWGLVCQQPLVGLVASTPLLPVQCSVYIVWPTLMVPLQTLTQHVADPEQQVANSPSTTTSQL